MPIRFDVEWLDAPGVADPVLASTWGRLVVVVDDGGHCVTRLLDHTAKSTREGVFGSVFPLARWIVENWWFLLGEPCRVSDFPGGRRLYASSRSEREWLARHSFLVAREGHALPDFSLYSDGTWLAGQWVPDPERNPLVHVVRFVGEGSVALERTATETALHTFVETVADRVRDHAPPSEDVDEFLDDWNLVRETSGDDALVCRRTATMGLDPYDTDSSDVVEFLRSSLNDLPDVLVRDALEATNASHVEPDFRWIQASVDDFALGDATDANGGPLAGTAFDAGYEAARRFRSRHGLPDGPLHELDRILHSRCQWPVQHRESRPIGHPSGILALAGRTRAGLPRVTFADDDARPNDRFRLARAIYFAGNEGFRESPRLVTRAYSWDQRASRAFAAELLAPADALREEVADSVTEDHVHALGEKFEVSPYVIRHQLANHGIARVEYD